MGFLKRLRGSLVWDLLPGQNIMVNGTVRKFAGEENGDIYYENGNGEIDIAPSAYVSSGNENRSDGREFCAECGSYYLPHQH